MPTKTSRRVCPSKSLSFNIGQAVRLEQLVHDLVQEPRLLGPWRGRTVEASNITTAANAKAEDEKGAAETFLKTDGGREPADPWRNGRSACRRGWPCTENRFCPCGAS